MNDPQSAPDVNAIEEPSSEPPLYGVGPLTLRELLITGVWFLAFLFSFFPLARGPFTSVWSSGLVWILTIGVPSVAVFLILLRRFSPDGIRGVGSLGVDQFASVAFSVSSVLWAQLVWDTIAFAAANGVWVRTWVMWGELILMLAGVFLTVVAPFVPVIRDDFRGRPEQIAHPNARPVRPVVPRPASVRPIPVAYPAPGYIPVPNAADPGSLAESARYEAFWVLVPVERDVLDEYGRPMFRVGPTAWTLVIEDRGTAYVVRHEDGRVGYLHDVTGVVRG